MSFLFAVPIIVTISSEEGDDTQTPGEDERHSLQNVGETSSKQSTKKNMLYYLANNTMTWVEIFLFIVLTIIIGTWLVLALRTLGEDTNSTSVAVSLFYIGSLVLFIIIIPFPSESVEYKMQEIKECKWIIENQETYLLFGKPNR